MTRYAIQFITRQGRAWFLQDYGDNGTTTTLDLDKAKLFSVEPVELAGLLGGTSILVRVNGNRVHQVVA